MTQVVADNTEHIDSLDADLEAYKWRNIKLEAYTRRENTKIVNIQEESEEDTEKLERNIFITKMQISAEDVNTIRFERVHGIQTKP